MDIIKALKLAKEQGKKVRPTINRELYVVYDTDKQKFVWSTSDELSSEKNILFGIPNHAIEVAIFGEWEEATTEADKRIIERKRKAIRQYCHNLKAGCEECYINKICDEYHRKRDVFNELDDSHRIENWSFKDVTEAYQILIEKKVKFECQ